jgi:prolyl oligopeptidase
MFAGWALGSACMGEPSLRPELPSAPSERAQPIPILVEHQSAKRPNVVTRREDVVDVLHGRRIPDPYRWLEKADDREVHSWVSTQNELLEATLTAIPERRAIRERIGQLLQIGQVSLPVVRRTREKGLRYFYTRRDGRQDQPALYVRDALHGNDRALVDPNAMSSDGTVALDWWVPSHDGSLLAYGTSEGGSEQSTLRIRDVATGRDSADVITRARYASVCWMPDNRRFFYSRFPEPKSVPKGEENYHRKIYEHVLGRDPDADPLVFGADRDMTEYPACAISEDGRWLVVRVHQGWNKSELLLADTRQSPLRFHSLTAGREHVYNPVLRNDALYVHTNEGAPRYALYEVDPRRPERERWKLVVAQHSRDVLDGVEAVGNQLLAAYLEGAASRLERFDRRGKSLGAVALPSLGASDGFSGMHDGKEAFFHFESFARPPEVRRIDLASGKVEVWERVEAPIAPDDYVVTSGSARSKDGTSVPYLVVHEKNVDLARGPHPTLLYGYGGFNYSLQPRFSRTSALFFERGGVYVQANLRGGGELGEEWHRAGQLDKKQNTFDDFYAVAQKLVADGVTSPERLAIHGRSNGGLLVAAAITQRPELFRAAVSGVPLADMLRYHRFLIAKLWIPEYGSADDPNQFEWLYAYSPYHHVNEQTAYPAVLFITAESDTRVDPMHARKMTAALQHASSSGLPVLLRTETKAGHGAGKPVSKVADEYADLYAFVLWQLGAIGGPSP